MFKQEKIFRPWASSSSSSKEQDSTISTTTSHSSLVVNNNIIKQTEKLKSKHQKAGIKFGKLEESQFVLNDIKKSYSIKAFDKTAMKNPSVYKITPDDFLKTSEGPNRVPSHFDPYSMCVDTIHANLAQTLGLSSSDNLFLESIAQGYAIEEYARILGQEQQAKLLLGRKQRPKKYKCPHCDVGFSNNGQLKGHIRIHTGERPFRCDEKECGKTFTRNEELTRHKRIHSGLRPFPCGQCGKRFGRKDHLKKHTRTHLQHRAMYAVPVMIPLDTWGTSTTGYPYIPTVYGY